MPTFYDPVADAEEASQALRGLAHASRDFTHPEDAYGEFTPAEEQIYVQRARDHQDIDGHDMTKDVTTPLPYAFPTLRHGKRVALLGAGTSVGEMAYLAPSPELRKWWSHDEDSFQEFSRRYHAELADREPRNPATLWLVTHGVFESATESALRQSPLWGLAGVIGAEQPQLWGGLIDMPDADIDASALTGLLSSPVKSVAVWRDGALLTPTLAEIDTVRPASWNGVSSASTSDACPDRSRACGE